MAKGGLAPINFRPTSLLMRLQPIPQGCINKGLPALAFATCRMSTWGCLPLTFNDPFSCSWRFISHELALQKLMPRSSLLVSVKNSARKRPSNIPKPEIRGSGSAFLTPTQNKADWKSKSAKSAKVKPRCAIWR
jgi:hypothetical protein